MPHGSKLAQRSPGLRCRAGFADRRVMAAKLAAAAMPIHAAVPAMLAKPEMQHSLAVARPCREAEGAER